MNTKAHDTKPNATEVAIAEKPGYVFAFISDLGNGMNINITGNLATNVSREDIDAEMDKLRGACNRIQAQAAVPAIEAKIYKMNQILTSKKQQLTDTLAKSTARTGKAPDAELANIHNMRVDIDHDEQAIKYETELLEKTKLEAV